MSEPSGEVFAAAVDDGMIGALTGLRDLLAGGGGDALSLVQSEVAHPEGEWLRAGVVWAQDLIRAGLLVREASGGVRARLRVGPSAGLWIVHDHPRSSEAPVMGVGMMSMVLAAFTPRARCGTVLDVGTGQGFLAILAARHAARVIGTDVDVRALECARLTAVMNGASGIEWRRGSMLEPAADLASACDLVVSNPPQLVSPRHVVSEGGASCAGDDFVEGLVRGAPAMLREGGFFACTAIWGEDGAWEARPREWAFGSGCDVWIVRLRRDDVEAYAEMWRGAIDERRGGDMSADGLVRWREHARERGETGVATALIFMRKRAGRNWIHAEPGTLVGVAEGATPESSVLVERVFAARTLLAEGGEAALVGARLGRAPGLTLVEGRSRGAAMDFVRHRTGFAMERPQTVLVRDVLSAIDGKRRGADVLAVVGAGASGERPIEILRDLLERGLIEVMPA
jgi:SAM-dependent methyltransferase